MEERKLETHLCVRIRRKGNEVARDDTAVLPSYSSASLGFASGMCGSVGEGAPGRRPSSGSLYTCRKHSNVLSPPA